VLFPGTLQRLGESLFRIETGCSAPAMRHAQFDTAFDQERSQNRPAAIQRLSLTKPFAVSAPANRRRLPRGDAASSSTSIVFVQAAPPSSHVASARDDSRVPPRSSTPSHLNRQRRRRDLRNVQQFRRIRGAPPRQALQDQSIRAKAAIRVDVHPHPTVIWGGARGPRGSVLPKLRRARFVTIRCLRAANHSPGRGEPSQLRCLRPRYPRCPCN
jgi:hypothetical protein